jgi:Bacterial membrane protein YfhO
VALAATVCVYNLPRLLTGSVQFDGLDVHYSSQRYLSDELHAGHLPFWTPYLFTGFPFLADLQVGAWYPLNWPFFLAGITPASINLELLVHSLIACGGAYALAMRLIGRPGPAVGVAMFYGLSGWFAAHSQHVGMFDTAAWLPWLMLTLESLAQRTSLARLTLAGLVGAAIALPGSFQVALYTFSGVAIWAALDALARRSWPRTRSFALGLGAAVIWGGLLAAVMILPALELVGQSIRTQLNARDVELGYFHPAALWTLANPDYYGLLSGHYTGPGDSTQHYFYAGILLVPLALFGARNARIVRTAALLGIPFLWYALGPAGGLFRLVARLPGFSSVELPMHGWFLPALGLALLGGAGLTSVESRLGRRATIAALAIILVDLIAVNQILNPLAYARHGFDELYGAQLAAFQAQVERVRPQRIYGPPLAAVAYRNHPLQSRVETTYGYNPLELVAYADYVAAAERNARLIAGLAASHQLLEHGRIEPTEDALPLAYFARRVVSVPDEAAALARLAELDPAEATIVVGAAPEVHADARAAVSVVARAAESVVLHYRSATPNLVRVALPAYPGWHAQLNGVELPLVRADYAFTGVAVPAGEGDVRLFYAPRLFWPSAIISVLALAAAVAALSVSVYSRGARPTIDLKSRIKWAWSKYPSSCASWAPSESPAASRSAASNNR